MNKLNQHSKKDAIKAAANYLKDILDLKEPLNIKLEEIDQTEDDKFWLITLSYDDIALENIFEGDTRAFKVFKVDKQTNDVISMKLRENEYGKEY